MAKQRLDRPQIGPVLQQMRGEGVAQHMRRDPAGVDPGGDREVMDQAKEAVPRQVARPPARREQKGRGPRAAVGLAAAA
jgi:hypothetical protein